MFGVAQILNRLDGNPFDASDEAQFTEFMASIAVILETWWNMSSRNGSVDAAADSAAPDSG